MADEISRYIIETQDAQEQLKAMQNGALAFASSLKVIAETSSRVSVKLVKVGKDLKTLETVTKTAEALDAAGRRMSVTYTEVAGQITNFSSVLKGNKISLESLKKEALDTIATLLKFNSLTFSAQAVKPQAFGLDVPEEQFANVQTSVASLADKISGEFSKEKGLKADKLEQVFDAFLKGGITSLTAGEAAINAKLNDLFNTFNKTIAKGALDADDPIKRIENYRIAREKFVAFLRKNNAEIKGLPDIEDLIGKQNVRHLPQKPGKSLLISFNEDLKELRKELESAQDIDLGKVFQTFPSGTGKEFNAIQNTVKSALDSIFADLVKVAGGADKVSTETKQAIVDLLRFGQIRIDAKVPDVRQLLGVTESLLSKGSPKAVAEFEKNYTRLIETFISAKDINPEDVNIAIKAFRGEDVGVLIGAQAKIRDALDQTFLSLGKVAKGSQNLAGELKRLGTVRQLFKSDILGKGLPNVGKAKIAASSKNELKEFERVNDQITLHLLKNVELDSAAIKNAYASIEDRTIKTTPAQKQFLALLDEARIAYNRMGLQAALTAATEVRGRKDAINAIKQSKTAMQDLRKLQGQQKRIAAYIETKTVTKAGLGLEDPEVFAPQFKFDDRDLLRYYTNLQTVRQEAAKTTLSIEEIDKVIAALDNPKAFSFLNNAQKRLYTGLNTLRSAYLKLKEIQDQVNQPGKVAKVQGIDAGIVKNQEAQLRNTLYNNIVARLKPVDLPININQTEINTALDQVKTALESTKLDTQQLAVAFDAAFTGNVTEQVPKIQRVAEAIREVLRVEEQARTGGLQIITAEDVINNTKRARQVKDIVIDLQRSQASVGLGLAQARETFVQPRQLSLTTPLRNTEAYTQSLINLDDVIIKTASDNREFNKALSLIRVDPRTLSLDPSVSSNVLDLRLAILKVIESYYSAEKAAAAFEKRQKRSAEQSVKAAQALAQAQTRPQAEQLLRTALVPAIPAGLDTKLFVAATSDIEKSIRSNLDAMDRLKLGVSDLQAVFNALGGITSINDLSADQKLLLPDIINTTKAQDAFNKKLREAQLPAKVQTKRAEAQAVLQPIQAQLPADITKAQEAQVTSLINKLIKEFGRGEVAIQDFERQFKRIRAGEQLIADGGKLDAFIEPMVKLHLALTKVGVGLTSTSKASKLLSDPLAILRKQVSILGIDSAKAAGILRETFRGNLVGPLREQYTQLTTTIDQLTAKGKALGLSEIEVNKSIIDAVRREINARKELATIRATKQEAAKARREQETADIQQPFQEVVQAFGPISPKIQGAALDTIRQKYIDLAREMLKANISAEELNDTIARVRGGGRGGGGGGFVPPLGPESEDFNRRIIDIEDTFDKAEKAGSNAAKGIAISWRGVFRLFQAHVLHSILAEIVGDFRQATAAAAEFERQVALIRTITTDADGSFEQWSASIRKVSDEIGKPSVEVATAAYDALSNQVAFTTQDIERFTTIAGNFARVTGSTTPDAVNLLSSAINSFGHTSDDAEEIAASFFETIDKGRVKAAGLANTYGRTSAFAKQLGLDYQDVNAAAVVLTQTGVNEADALTQINALFSKLIKPTVETEKLFKSLGVTSGTELVTSLGGLGETFAFLAQEAAKGNVEFTDIFNELRGSRGAFTLAADGAEAFKKALADVGGDVSRLRTEIDKFNDASAGIRLSKEYQQFRNFITDDLGREALKVIDNVTKQFGGLAATLELVTKAVVASGQAFALYTTLQLAAFSLSGIQAFVKWLYLAELATKGLAIWTSNLGARLILAKNAGGALGLVLTKISPPIAIITAAFVIYDQFVRKAAGSIHTIGEEFEGVFKTVRESNEKIVQSYAESVKKSTDIVKAGIKEQIQANTKLVTDTRKGLNQLAAGQAAISKDIEGRLKNVFKSISDSFDEGIERTKNKITDLKRDIEKIGTDRAEIVLDFDRKKFDTSVAAAPEQKTQLTLERIATLEKSKIEAARIRDLEQVNNLHKEELNLLDSLETDLTKLTALDLKRKNTLLAAQAVQQFKPLDVSSIRRAQGRLDTARHQTIQSAEGRQDKLFDIKDLQREKAAFQDLVNKVNQTRVKGIVSPETTKQMARLTIEQQQLVKSLTNANGQQLDGNRLLEIRTQLTDNHLQQLTLIEQNNKRQLQFNEELVKQQQFLADEHERYLDIINDIKIVNEQGELLPPQERDAAIKRIKDVKQQLVDLFKIEGQLDLDFDPKKFKAQIDRLDTEVKLKLDSLAFEESIAQQQKRLTDTSSAYTDLGNKATEALDKIVAGINEVNAALVNSTSNVGPLASQIASRLANIRTQSNVVVGDETNTKKIAEKYFNLTKVQAALDRIKLRAPKLEFEASIEKKLFENRKALEANNDNLRLRERIEANINSLNKERQKLGDIEKLKLDNAKDIAAAFEAIQSGGFNNLQFTEDETLSQVFQRLSKDINNVLTKKDELEDLKQTLELSPQAIKDPLEFLDKHDLKKVTEEFSEFENKSTKGIVRISAAFHDLALNQQELTSVTKSVATATQGLSPTINAVESKWSQSVRNMGDRFFEFIQKIKTASGTIKPPTIEPTGPKIIKLGRAGPPLPGIAAQPKVIEVGKRKPTIDKIADALPAEVDAVGQAIKGVGIIWSERVASMIANLEPLITKVQETTNTVSGLQLPKAIALQPIQLDVSDLKTKITNTVASTDAIGTAFSSLPIRITPAIKAIIEQLDVLKTTIDSLKTSLDTLGRNQVALSIATDFAKLKEFKLLVNLSQVDAAKVALQQLSDSVNAFAANQLNIVVQSNINDIKATFADILSLKVDFEQINAARTALQQLSDSVNSLVDKKLSVIVASNIDDIKATFKEVLTLNVDTQQINTAKVALQQLSEVVNNLNKQLSITVDSNIDDIKASFEDTLILNVDFEQIVQASKALSQLKADFANQNVDIINKFNLDPLKDAFIDQAVIININFDQVQLAIDALAALRTTINSFANQPSIEVVNKFDLNPLKESFEDQAIVLSVNTDQIDSAINTLSALRTTIDGFANKPSIELANKFDLNPLEETFVDQAIVLNVNTDQIQLAINALSTLRTTVDNFANQSDIELFTKFDLDPLKDTFIDQSQIQLNVNTEQVTLASQQLANLKALINELNVLPLTVNVGTSANVQSLVNDLKSNLQTNFANDFGQRLALNQVNTITTELANKDLNLNVQPLIDNLQTVINNLTNVNSATINLGFSFQAFNEMASQAVNSVAAFLQNLIGIADTASRKIAQVINQAAAMPVAQGFAKGGLVTSKNYFSKGGNVTEEEINYYAKGGLVPIMYTPGEAFVPPDVTKRYRRDLEAINKNRYAKGGFVPKGTDTKAALVPHNTFIVNKRSTEKYGHLIQSMMNGTYEYKRYQYGGVVKSKTMNNSSTTIGDIHVHMNNTTHETPETSAKNIANALRRNMRLGR